MGKFFYRDQVRADFEDRLLAHLQVVIGNKLRRGEPFYFTWKDDVSAGGGHTSVWLHPGPPSPWSFTAQPAGQRRWTNAGRSLR